MTQQELEHQLLTLSLADKTESQVKDLKERDRLLDSGLLRSQSLTATILLTDIKGH